MAEILVTAASVRAKAEELRAMCEQFKSNVADLEAQESNLNSMWDGAANDAFHNAFTRDKMQFDTFYNEMIKYAATLEQIACEYEKAEANNVNIGNTRTY